MELFLNLAWLCLAALVTGTWLVFGPRRACSMRLQLAALFMLVLILFPVISVTDDLQTALQLAEDDSYLRRDHAAPLVTALDLPAQPFTLLEPVTDRPSEARIRALLPLLPADEPARAAVGNRPPPAI